MAQVYWYLGGAALSLAWLVWSLREMAKLRRRNRAFTAYLQRTLEEMATENELRFTRSLVEIWPKGR